MRDTIYKVTENSSNEIKVKEFVNKAEAKKIILDWRAGLYELDIDYDLEILDGDFGSYHHKYFVIGGEDYIEFEIIN